jgi:hypothetical protein
MRRLAASAFVILAAGQPAAAAESVGVVLQGLDKITARISRLEARIHETIVFGALEITPRACHQTPPEETPESSAFLEIVERKSEGGSRPVFSGWMFASSPALSAMEHPVYDVWVLGCLMDAGETSEP